MHVDQEHATVALYRIDLVRGTWAAGLASQVQEWRRAKALLTPYVVPGVATIQPITRLVEDARLTPSTIAVAPTVPAEMVQWSSLPAPDQNPLPVPFENPETVGGAGVPFEPTEAPADPLLNVGHNRLLSAAELLSSKFTKAQVQQYCREHGLTDLAHTKKVLVQMLGQAGRLAADNAPVASLGKDPAELVGPVGGSDPTDPHDPAFAAAMLRKITQAESAADLNRLHTYVVRVGGDQAWSDTMTEAARERLAEVDADQQPNPDQRHSATLAAVAECNSSQELADLWERVTVGGSVADNWPDEVNQAAQTRLAEIRAATPPPPANPFA